MTRTKKTAKKAVKKIIKKTVKNDIKKAVKKTNKKTDLMLVHNPANAEQSFYIASELADDESIEKNMLGQAMEHYVYSFQQEGKTVTGLSVAGVNETIRSLNRKANSGYKIRIIPDSLKINRDVEYNGEKGVEVQVIAENMVTGDTGIGIKFEPYTKKGKKGSYANTFCIEKAVSKAERNAKRKLMPEKMAVEMIKKFIAQNKYIQISSPVQQNNRAIGGEVVQEKAKNNTDYLIQLKHVLHKNGATNEAEAIEIYNEYTGENIKSLRVGQERAKQMLWDLLNSPCGGNLKK